MKRGDLRSALASAGRDLVFDPKPHIPRKVPKRHILTEWAEEDYAFLKEQAAKRGITLKQFTHDAVRFAISCMEDKDK